MLHRQAIVRVPAGVVAVLVTVVLLRLVPLPFKHIFVVLFTAVLLASAIAPAATALERYRVPRGVSILLAYLAVVAVLVGIVALFVPLVVSEIDNLKGKLPGYEKDLNTLLARFTASGKQPLSTDELFNKISGNLSDIAAQLGRAVFRIAGVLVQLLIILVAAFFLAVDPKFAEHIVTRFAPPAQRDRTLEILRRIGRRMGHWVRAQLVLAVFFGFFFGLGLWIAQVPFALTLGMIGGVLELIPYVGGFVTLILAVLVALTDDPIKVAFVVAIYTVVTNIEAHVVAPAVMGRILGLHPLTVVIALFIGTETLGILGALLSVPVAVVIQVVTDELYVIGDTETGLDLPRELSAADGVSPIDAKSSEPA